MESEVTQGDRRAYAAFGMSLILVALLAVVGACQTTYYFDKSAGNDASSGLTPDTAKQNLSWFNANARSGDTALLQGGDIETIAFAPVVNDTTLSSWGTGRGIIDTSAGPTTAILIDDVQGTTIVNIEADSANNGIYLDGDCSRTTIANCYVHDCTSNGLNSGNTAGGAVGNRVLVVDSEFSNNGIDGVGVRGSIHLTLRRCTIADNVQDGASAHENGTIRAYDCVVYGSEDGFNHINDSGTNIIERCYVYGCPGGDCVAIAAGAGTYVDAQTIIRNSILVLDTTAPVVADSCARTIGGNLIIDGCVLENPNTSIVRTYNVYSSGAIAGGTDVSVTNTIFLGADDVDAVYAFITTNASAQILRWDNNIYEERATATAPFRLDGTGGFLTYAQWIAAAATVNSEQVDTTSYYTTTAKIGLTNRAALAAAATNAKPTANSIAVGRGFKVFGVSSTLDYTGGTRSISYPWDIGAFAMNYDEVVLSTERVGTVPLPVPHPSLAVFSRGWSIAEYAYLDISSVSGDSFTRTGGGKRVVISCGSTGAATLAFGFDDTPASITGGIGVPRTGAVTLAFPGEYDIPFAQAVTSIAAVSAANLPHVAVTVYP